MAWDINVDKVSKKFCKSLKHSMLHGIEDIARNMAGIRSRGSILRKNEFWAVNDVSFDIKKGEVLGIIGPNGSGKSTLLKMLNGIFWPDKGKISVNGRVGALIEVGAGFHPMLTGRENIYVNGAILGMSREEVDDKIDDIIAFADIGDFLDTPVKHYSSGMFVRLGFAIAVHCEPQILLIDEVLAVGDVGFRSKCYNAITKLTADTVVVFISHNMSQVGRICSKVMVINKGKQLFLGDTKKGIEIYNSLFETENTEVAGSGRAEILSFDILDDSGRPVSVVRYNQCVCFRITFTATVEVRHPVVFLGFYDSFGKCVAECTSSYMGAVIENTGETIEMEVKIPHFNLNPDSYQITCLIYDENLREHMAWHYCHWTIKVEGDFFGQNPVQFPGQWKTLSSG